MLLSEQGPAIESAGSLTSPPSPGRCGTLVACEQSGGMQDIVAPVLSAEEIEGLNVLREGVVPVGCINETGRLPPTERERDEVCRV